VGLAPQPSFALFVYPPASCRPVPRGHSGSSRPRSRRVPSLDSSPLNRCPRQGGRFRCWLASRRSWRAGHSASFQPPQARRYRAGPANVLVSSRPWSDLVTAVRARQRGSRSRRRCGCCRMGWSGAWTRSTRSICSKTRLPDRVQRPYDLVDSRALEFRCPRCSAPCGGSQAQRGPPVSTTEGGLRPLTDQGRVLMPVRPVDARDTRLKRRRPDLLAGRGRRRLSWLGCVPLRQACESSASRGREP
jgi:hypothetical protein